MVYFHTRDQEFTGKEYLIGFSSARKVLLLNKLVRCVASIVGHIRIRSQ